MSELKKHTLKVRVTELENRLNNLHKLVTNIAANQEEIVNAITTNDVAKVDNKEIPNQLRIDDEAERLDWKDEIYNKHLENGDVSDSVLLNDYCEDEDCEEKVCLMNKCK